MKATSEPDRRELSFSSQDEMVAEVERLAQGKVRTSGKHTFAEIIRHLALTNDMGSGRIIPPKAPLILRLLMPLIRNSIINGPVKPGVKLPSGPEKFFWPSEEIDVPTAIVALKSSAVYYKEHGPLPVHPFFGKIPKIKAEELNLKHAAMHLSFVHPVD